MVRGLLRYWTGGSCCRGRTSPTAPPSVSRRHLGLVRWMQASTTAVGAAEVATGPERLPPEAEHTDNACSLQAPDSDKGAPSSDPWAPRMHYTVDVAPSKRTACHECGRAFNSGAERKHNAHMHPVPCETGVYPRFSHRRAARCARLHLHRVRQRVLQDALVPRGPL